MALPPTGPGAALDVGGATIACPVCNAVLPQNQIEEHVNICLLRDEQNSLKRPGTVIKNPQTKRLKTEAIPAPAVIPKAPAVSKKKKLINGEQVNIVSAIHKAIKASDERTALQWMVRSMLGGVFPNLLIAQRLVKIAAEDIGLADPNALVEAVACLQGCQGVSVQDSELLVAQCIMRLARAPKSRVVYDALTECKRSLGIPVPAVPQGQAAPIRNGHHDVRAPLVPATQNIPLNNGHNGYGNVPQPRPAEPQNNKNLRRGYEDVIAPLAPQHQPPLKTLPAAPQKKPSTTQALPVIPPYNPVRNRNNNAVPMPQPMPEDEFFNNGNNDVNYQLRVVNQGDFTNYCNEVLRFGPQTQVNWYRAPIPQGNEVQNPVPTGPHGERVANGYKIDEEERLAFLNAEKENQQPYERENENDEVIVPPTAMPLPFRTDGHDYDEVIIIDDIEAGEKERVPHLEQIGYPEKGRKRPSATDSETEVKPPDISPQISDVYSELVALEARALVPNAEPFECGVCMDTCAAGQGAVLRECAHAFCRPCLQDLVRHSTDAVLKCPETGCAGTLLEREVRSVASAEQYEGWLSRGLAAAESGARHAFHCRTRDCVGWALVEPPATKFPCPVCQFINCVPCEAIHEDETCEVHRARLKAIASKNRGSADQKTKDMIDKMIKKGQAMECPGCGVIITKASGCDWMQCSACKTEICWATRGPRWGPKGRGDTSGGCRCRMNEGLPCDRKCRNCH